MMLCRGLQLCTPNSSYVHVLSNKFCGRDSKEDISNAEQLPVLSWKKMMTSRAPSSSLLAQMCASLV